MDNFMFLIWLLPDHYWTLCSQLYKPASAPKEHNNGCHMCLFIQCAYASLQEVHPQHLRLVPGIFQQVRQQACISRTCLILMAHFPTWDMLGPADVHHQLSVRQVTQRSQGLDVAVWYCWVWHGINLLWLGNQQVRDDFVICKAAKGNWHDHQTRRKTQRQRVGEFLLRMATNCSTPNVGQQNKWSFARPLITFSLTHTGWSIFQSAKIAAVRFTKRQSYNFHTLISVWLLFHAWHLCIILRNLSLIKQSNWFDCCNTAWQPLEM